MIPAASMPDTCCDLSEEINQLQQLQHLMEEERAASQQYHKLLPSASENHIIIRAKDKQKEQLQLQSIDGVLCTTQELQNGLTLLNTSQRAFAAEQKTQESNSVSPLNRPPSPEVSEAVCLMVEDPYFDTPMSSPSSEEAPVDSNEDTKQWVLSPVFNTPFVFLNDQSLELNAACSGKLSYLCTWYK